MKTILSIVVLFLVAGNISAQYTFTGRLNGLADSTVVELIPGATHKDEKPIAEATVKNGIFIFKGDQKEPRLFYLRAKGLSGIYRIFIENANIQLIGDVKETNRNGYKAIELLNTQVSGSPTQKLYEDKIAFRKDLDLQYQAIRADNVEISREMGEARGAKDQAKLDSLSKTEAGLKLAKDEKAFFDNVATLYKKAIFDNKDSWWGPFLMLDIMSWFGAEQQEWYKQLSPEAQNSYYGQIVKREAFPKTFSGAPAPQFTVTGNNGSTTLAQLSKGKKYVVIDFWASWCAPCRKEIPHMKKIYDEYASKGFEIISISIDDDANAWKQALEKEQMKWPNYHDSKKDIKELYNIRTIPATFLVDENGQIILENFKSDVLVAKLKELIK